MTSRQRPSLHRASSESSRERETSFSSNRETVSSADRGKPLESSVRSSFEQSYEHDFSNVRVNTGAEAERLTTEADAAALAVGDELFFKPGAYNPSSSLGRFVIAHELAHVVQSHNHDATPSARHSSEGDSAERDAHTAASAAVRGERAAPQAAPQAQAPAFLGGLWNVLSGNETPASEDASFGRDVAGRTAWGGLTDDVIGGLTDVAALGNVGGIGTGMTNAAKPVANVLGPLGLLSGGIDMFNGITGDRNFENNEKVGLGLGNFLSGGASAAGLFGVGGGVTGTTAMTGAGLAEAGAATGAVGGALGAGVAAGGQVIGAGLAGYGIGKLMDAGVGALGGATTGDKRTLSDRMVDRAMGTNEWIDNLTGSDTAGDIVGGLQLGAESLVSPAVAAGEMIGDLGVSAGRGIKNTASSAYNWLEGGIHKLYGMPF